MLPRVNEVLKKFLSPVSETVRVASSSAGGKEAGGDQQKAPTPAPDHPNKKTSPELKLVVNNEPNQEPEKLGATQSPPTQIADTPTVIGLLSLFKNQKGHVLNWLGIKSYKKSASEKSKTGKFKKGAMLDQEAD